jgi:long-chain acyl-CoA synthetase
MASHLQSLDLPPATKIALLSKNCAHWIMADLAIIMTGHVSVPIYPTVSSEVIRQIVEHSESKVIFVGKLDDYENQRAGIPDHVQKIAFSTYGTRAALTWEDLITKQPRLEKVTTRASKDLLTIMYTSGTTGKPKGVMHSNFAFDSATKEACNVLGITNHPILFSYLPMSHIAERMATEMMGVYKGATISFAESLDSFAKNLSDTQPTQFLAVPRIWAKFKEKILQKMPQKKLDRLLSIPVISGIVKRSIRKKLGLSRAKIIVSGAAPLAIDVANWFERLGIVILQVYGMTEDCVYAHFNTPGDYRHGTVGKPLKELKTKIAEDGEIRIKCPGLTKGYYKEPELTEALFDEEGYLKTGDRGEYSSDGYLTIIGRVKDQFKTDKGKYVDPAPIEAMVLENSDIEQACVVGMGVPQPIVLSVLSELGRSKSKEEVIRSIAATLEKVNPHLESYERLASAVIMKAPWTIENGLMTPSMKIKRNEVEKIHLRNYSKWYHEEGVVVWE